MQILQLTRWIQQHPDAPELTSARAWLLAHPDSPGLSASAMSNLRGRHMIGACFACEKPATYYAGQQGACDAHRDTLPSNERRKRRQESRSAGLALRQSDDRGGPTLKLAGVPNDTRGRFAALQHAIRFTPNGHARTKNRR